MDPSARDSPLLAQPFPAFNLTTLEDPSRVVDESLFKDKVRHWSMFGESGAPLASMKCRSYWT